MAEKKRNIVFIMCDQLRADFLSCYGADFSPTPNLDELARNGVVFDNAITASTVCAPARAAMITGRHVSSHGAWTNNSPCNPGVEKLPERMNRAGYMTAAFGCYDHAPRSASYGYRYRRLLDGSRPGSEYLAWLQERHPEETNAYATDNGLQFKYTEDAANMIAKGSYSYRFGARNMRRYIQKNVEDEVANLIINGYSKGIAGVNLDCDGEKLIIESI